MIFKRNAKGLLEREMSPIPMHEPAHTFASTQNSMVRHEAPKQMPPTAPEKKEVNQTSFSSQQHIGSYPQEDFPSYVHSSQEVQSVDYLQDMEQATGADVPETTLGEGVVFKGELAFKRYLCINGEFEGVLSSSGKLRVGKTGWVKSNLRLKSAVVEGKVEGDIFVDDLLELRGSACVRGNITARYLRVDDGVTLVGHVNICPEGHSSAPQQSTSFDSQV